MLTFADLEDFAAILIPTAPRTALAARLKQFGRAGFPLQRAIKHRGLARADYTIEEAMMCGTCLALAASGMGVARAIEVAGRDADVIREGCAAAAAARWGGFVQPSADPVLVVELDDGLGAPSRIDRLDLLSPWAIETIGLQAILVRIAPLVNAVDQLFGEREGLRDQLQRLDHAAIVGWRGGGSILADI